MDIIYIIVILSILILSIVNINLQLKTLNDISTVFQNNSSVCKDDFEGNVNSSNNILTDTFNTIPIDTTLDTTFKAYMDYRCITNKASTQWQIQQQAHTDSNGLRKVGNYYCVALGTFYSNECGTKFKIILSSGVEFDAIVADIKNPLHTDTDGKYTPLLNSNGVPILNFNNIQMVNVVEFIVDENKLPNYVRYTKGCVSSVGFDGDVVAIKKIEE